MVIILTKISLPYAIRSITQAADGSNQIELSPIRKEKTHQQRKLFHATCHEIGESLGYTTGQIKEMIKTDYFGVDKVVIDDKTYHILKPSEELDRMDYSKLCDFANQWRAERGV